MYKMIFVDLDSTLLDDSKKISQENVNSIKRAYTEKGVITVITTGRPEHYVREIYKSNIGIFADYIIASNGAVIKNQKTNEYLKNSVFSSDEVKILKDIFIKEKGDCLIMDSTEKSIYEKSKWDGKDNIGISNDKNNVTKENVIVSCTIEAKLKNIEKIRQKIMEIKTLESTPICNYVYEENGKKFTSKYIDIVKAGCTKKNAIQLLVNKLNIKQEEIIVIGDRK